VQLSRQTIDGLQKGDDRARRECWERLFSPVYAICAHILGSGVEASDTAADLLSDFIFHHVHALQNPAGAGAYLRLMAVRRAIRARDHRNRMCEFHDDAMATGATGPEESAEFRLLQDRLPRCLNALTPKARSALRLKYTARMANDQIGTLLGGSKQYIGRLLAQSLERLRRCLEKGAATP
jgi:RNA polymerase sigma factor (sigma-70 family)